MIKYKNLFLLLVVVLTVIISCDSGEDDALKSDSSEVIELFLTENELIDSVTVDDSGIYYQITESNEGGDFPSTGDVLGIYYSANALNEIAFDAHQNNGTNEPKRLHFNTNSVLPIGLDIALSLMKVGEKGIFYIPYDLAYGDLTNMSSIIPDQAVIVLELELATIQSTSDIAIEEEILIDQFILDHELDDSVYVSVDSVMIPIDSTWEGVVNDMISVNTVFDPTSMTNVSIDSVMLPLDSSWVQLSSGVIPVDSVFLEIDSVELLTSGIYYKMLLEGSESIVVNTGDIANIEYSLYTLGSYPDTPIDATLDGEVFSFEHSQDVVITGLDEAVSELEKGERALIIIPSRLGYRGSVFMIPQSHKQYFVDNGVVPDYVTAIDPYQVLVFEINLLNP